MSWGYWGIVTGLVVQVVMFFVCMTIVYSNAKSQRHTLDRSASEAVEVSKRASVISRHAA
jgi:hypothetical protein